MNKIKRYNPGFGVFGPLEQCDHGRFVRYEDFAKLDDELNLAKADRDRFAMAHRDMSSLYKVIADNSMRLDGLNTYLTALLFILLGIIAVESLIIYNFDNAQSAKNIITTEVKK